MDLAILVWQAKIRHLLAYLWSQCSDFDGFPGGSLR